MSYCVNCGVELNSNEKRCPLCSTPVINPNLDSIAHDLPPYPPKSEYTVERKIKHTTALLISVILLVPLLVCPLCDFLATGGISWSLYAIFGITLGWILIVPPILMHHDIVLKCAWIDFISITVFLYWVCRITPKTKGSFEKLSLPIVCVLMILFMLIFVLRKAFKLKPIITTAAVIFEVGIFCVSVDALVNNFISGSIAVSWSLPVLIGCTAAAALLLIISRLTKLKSSIRKRMHI